MFGLFDLIGSSFLPLMQFGFWVFGLSEQAEALGPSAADPSSDTLTPDDTAKVKTNDGSIDGTDDRALVAEDRSFMAAPDTVGDEAGSTPPGAFPQVDRAVQSYDGAPDLSTVRAHSAINALTRVSESLAHFDENSSLLSLHLLIEDQNGLSVPRLEAGAAEALQVPGLLQGAHAGGYRHQSDRRHHGGGHLDGNSGGSTRALSAVFHCDRGRGGLYHRL